MVHPAVRVLKLLGFHVTATTALTRPRVGEPGVRVFVPLPISRPTRRTFQVLFVLPDQSNVPVLGQPDSLTFRYDSSAKDAVGDSVSGGVGDSSGELRVPSKPLSDKGRPVLRLFT